MELKIFIIYGSALINYTMNSTINVGDDTNIGTISNGINYYILANGIKKYFIFIGMHIKLHYDFNNL